MHVRVQPHQRVMRWCASNTVRRRVSVGLGGDDRGDQRAVNAYGDGPGVQFR